MEGLLRKTAFEKPDGSGTIQPVAFIGAVRHHRASP